MEYINVIAQNSVVEPTITGLIGGIGSKLVFGNQAIFFGDFPVLSSLNGYDASLLYFGVFAGSNAMLSLTGDFILPLLMKNDWTAKLARYSRPMSVGALSALLLFLTNGLYIDTDNTI